MTEDETETCWHLMITAYSGAVSILQNLDAPTARQAYRSLKPDSWPTVYLNLEPGMGVCRDGSRAIINSEAADVVIIGPEGRELDPWRGVEPLTYDVRERRYVATPQ